jgi:hypothetical protein
MEAVMGAMNNQHMDYQSPQIQFFGVAHHTHDIQRLF